MSFFSRLSSSHWILWRISEASEQTTAAPWAFQPGCLSAAAVEWAGVRHEDNVSMVTGLIHLGVSCAEWQKTSANSPPPVLIQLLHTQAELHHEHFVRTFVSRHRKAMSWTVFLLMSAFVVVCFFKYFIEHLWDVIIGWISTTNSTWPPQLIEFKKHKHCYNSVSSTYEIRTDPQHWALIVI